MSAEPYDFYLKNNDTSEAIERELKDEDGNAEDLSTAVGVRFHMWKPDGTVVVDAAATFPNGGADGIARYTWDPSDTTEPGSYLAEFEVEVSAGQTETWPNHRDLQILIRDEGA